jgi:thiol:disulfide interchange protein DsbD
MALLAGFSLGAAAVDPSELLDPHDAFRLSVGALDARTAEVEFRIAKGYYLYRDRFRFETASGRVIAEAKLPAGEMKQDAFFGNSVTYRDHVRIRVPLSREDLALGRTRLKVISQGCADVGVCYVPQEQWVEVKLGAASGSKVSPR